uniref:Uncharacterized protein n=1 Tax=Tetranychus urticae TaxID=32264 RepID=A0A158P544_TETUR
MLNHINLPSAMVIFIFISLLSMELTLAQLDVPKVFNQARKLFLSPDPTTRMKFAKCVYTECFEGVA